MKKMEKDILEDHDESQKEKKSNKHHDGLGVTMKSVNKSILPFSPVIRVRRRRPPNGRKISQISVNGYNHKHSLGYNKSLLRHVTEEGCGRKITSDEEIVAGARTTKDMSAPEKSSLFQNKSPYEDMTSKVRPTLGTSEFT
jgi:hypothetical protein